MNDGSSEDTLGLVNEEVFFSIPVRLTMKNNTTRTVFKEEPHCALLEVTEEGMVIEAPEKCCALNHSLVFDLLTKSQSGPVLQLTGTVKVVGIESMHDGRERLTLTLMQFDAHLWADLLKVFQSRQDEIDRFMKAARGY